MSTLRSRPPFGSIDVHTHLAPSLPGSATRPGPEALYHAEHLSTHLAAIGVDRAWVSPPPPFYRQGATATETSEWVRRLDAGMRDRLADSPDLDRLTYLPFDQPTVALDLIADVDDSIGWTAAAGGGSLALDAPALDAVWAALTDLGRPLVLHPGESPDPRLDRHYLSNLLGNPVETGVAAAQLVLGGVLQAHPNLKVVLVHCGGIVPAVVGRWSHGVTTARPGIAPGTPDPLTVVRRLWCDALAYRPDEVDLALATFGDDHVVLGSDYPFPMGLDDPTSSVAHLPSALRDRIAGNAHALLSPASATRQEAAS